MGSKAISQEYLWLLKNMHKEITLLLAPTQIPARTLSNDWRKLFKRCVHEGLSFTTITLPTLGKAITSSFLTRQFISPCAFTKEKGTVLPKFYFGLFNRIYEPKTGVIRDCPDVESIRLIYQLCFMFYKLELPYTDKQKDDVMERYLADEEDLKSIFLVEQDPLLCAARKIVTDLFKGFDPLDITPQISNGALATGEVGAAKYQFSRHYNAIHRIYPYYRYFTASLPNFVESIKNRDFENHDDLLDWYRGLVRLHSGTSKMVFVNKDSRGPRTISMEPAEYQYIQQGLKNAFVEHLEKKTKNQINFLDQTKNQTAALEGSIQGDYSTYDFSAASDRVSMELVNSLFREVPNVLAALSAVRTTHTETPSGEILKLRKYAPMGSAMCFPVMATCIYAITKAMAPDLPILVYGDDLIVQDDSRYVNLPSLFSKYKMKINVDKSFTRGRFRESCGCDAFAGEVITPVRIKKELTTCAPEYLAALVDTSNVFYKAGYWHLAGCLREIIQTNVTTAIPTSHVCENVDGLSFCFATDAISDTVINVSDDFKLSYKRRTLNLHVPKLDTKVADQFSLLIGLTRPSADLPPSCIVIRNKSKATRLKSRYRDLHSTWTGKRIFA